MTVSLRAMELRIGIDLDGVVADFNRGWITAWNARHGTDLDVSQVDGWDCLPRLTGLASMDEFWDWARDLGEGRSLFRDLRPFDGAIESIRALEAAGHDPVVITAKPRWAVPDTFGWLSDVGFPTREVHVTDDKWHVDCDVYIDDAPHVLASYVQHRPEALILRFVRGWNVPVTGTTNVESWDAILREVEALVLRTRAA